jgi:hypothetical protein
MEPDHRAGTGRRTPDADRRQPVARARHLVERPGTEAQGIIARFDGFEQLAAALTGQRVTVGQ